MYNFWENKALKLHTHLEQIENQTQVWAGLGWALLGWDAQVMLEQSTQDWSTASSYSNSKQSAHGSPFVSVDVYSNIVQEKHTILP